MSTIQENQFINISQKSEKQHINTRLSEIWHSHPPVSCLKTPPMNMLLFSLPGMSTEEMSFIDSITKDLSEEQQKQFIMIYSSRRKDPQMILILTLLGFVGVAGVHRMIVGEIGMGLVYFFTGGFCLIGTIVDIINYKNISGEFNRRQAMESVGMVKQYVK